MISGYGDGLTYAGTQQAGYIPAPTSARGFNWDLFGRLVNDSFVNNPDHIYDDALRAITGKYPSEPGFVNSAVESLKTGAGAVKDMLNHIAPDGSMQPSSSGAGAGHSPLPPSVIDYLNAELASHYGMSKETAYQEALANTSYQRAVKDMQAAGLNPAAIFGSGKGYTAPGVAYATSASSGSGRGGGSGGSSKKDDKLFSTGAYNGIATAAGIVGAVLTKSTSGYWAVSSAAKGLMSAMDALF